MGGHDHLADAGLVHAAQQLQELELAGRRQRRFRLVEDEEALPPAALLEEAQEAFAVRMGQEVGRRPPSDSLRRLVEIARDGEEALGAEEPALVIFGSQLARSASASAPPIASSAPNGRPAGSPAAARLVVAGERGDAFEQRRFARAVLADDDGDGRSKLELEIVAQEGRQNG